MEHTDIPHKPKHRDSADDTGHSGSTATPAATLSEIGQRVLAAYQAFMQRMVAMHAPEFMEVGITMGQAKVLYVVAAGGETRMSHLATRLGVTLSTASGVVERLVEMGLLARHEAPGDRRQVWVALTPDGLAQLERFRELNERQLRHLFARLSDDQLVILGRAIDVLTDAAAAEAAADPPPNREGNSA